MQRQPNYIIDNQNHKIAVQLDKKITETLENYVLFQFMKKNKKDDKLSLREAKKYYKSLKANKISK